MMKDRKEIWIKVGYEMFAMKGQIGLQIEPISRIVGKNKSSFYHHFADIDIFLDELLAFHLNQSKLISEKESKAKNFNPDIINILVEHKIDILFSKQLLLNQQNEKFKRILQIFDKNVADVYIFLLKTDFNLNLKQKGVESFFELLLHDFFLQINAENLNSIWLTEYVSNIKRLAKNLE
jgi:AcrR family transcriptional regulator